MMNYLILIIAVFLISGVQIVIKLRLSAVHGELPSSGAALPAFFPVRCAIRGSGLPASLC